jgi:hypothetical protein
MAKPPENGTGWLLSHTTGASAAPRKTAVSRFRSSPHRAATSFAKVGIEGHQQRIDLVWLWFRNPYDERAARPMQPSEPPHQGLSTEFLYAAALSLRDLAFQGFLVPSGFADSCLTANAGPLCANKTGPTDDHESPRAIAPDGPTANLSGLRSRRASPAFSACATSCLRPLSKPLPLSWAAGRAGRTPGSPARAAIGS